MSKKNYSFQILIIILLIGFVCQYSYSTTINISVANIQFTPSTVSATVGDTIKWNWVNGAHTTTCDGTALTSRPAGAAAWSNAINSISTTFKYVVTVAGTYNYKCMPHGGLGMVGVLNVSAPAVTLNLTSIIEGFWNGAAMVSDTVKSYLRNATSPYAKVDSAKVKLNTSGTGALTFSNAASGNYFIVVIHRNSIETWSKNAQSFTSGGTTTYDFTTVANKAYGDNLVLKSGKFTIYSGDVNQDGAIDGTDTQLIDNDAANFASGYISSDVNGDTVTDGSDALIAENNATNFVTKATPLAVVSNE